MWWIFVCPHAKFPHAWSHWNISCLWWQSLWFQQLYFSLVTFLVSSFSKINNGRELEVNLKLGHCFFFFLSLRKDNKAFHQDKMCRYCLWCLCLNVKSLKLNSTLLFKHIFKFMSIFPHSLKIKWPLYSQLFWIAFHLILLWTSSREWTSTPLIPPWEIH